MAMGISRVRRAPLRTVPLFFRSIRSMAARVRASFRLRLTLAITAIGMALFMLLAGGLAHREAAELARTLDASLDAVSLQVADGVRAALQERVRDVRLLGEALDSRRVNENGDAYQAELARLHATVPEYTWLAIANASGNIMAASRAGGADDHRDLEASLPAVIDRKLFASGSRSVTASLNVARASVPDSEWFIHLAVPLGHREGGPAGWLLAHLDIRWLASSLFDRHFEASESPLLRVAVVSGGGEVLLGSGHSAEAVASLEPRLLRQTGGRARVNAGGHSHRLAWAPAQVDGIPFSAGWRVVTLHDSQRVDAALPAVYLGFGSIALGASLVFAMVAWWASGRLVRPVEQMAAAAERIRRGEAALYEDRLAGREDELGGLSRALVALVGTQNERQEALQSEVAQRLRVEGELRASEARFRRAIWQTPVPAMIHDQTGRVLLVNNAWREMTGYGPDELGSIRAWTDRAYGASADAVRGQIAGLFHTPDRVDEGELQVRTAQGTWRDWHFHSSVLGEWAEGRMAAMSVAVDVTERRDAERSLAQSRRVYRELFAANPHPMWLYDVESLAFIEVNDAAVEKYGYSVAEFLSMTIADIRPRDDLDVLRDALAVVRRTSLHHSGIRQHRLKDGTVILVEITAHDIDYGERPARLVLAQDVTARLQAERQVRQLNAELETRVAERTRQLEVSNRELETFAYSVSHDLKAPLRGIEGFGRLLQEDCAGHLSAQCREFLDSILKSAGRMDALIDGLLAYSRLDRQDMRVVSTPLEPLIRQQITAFAPRAEARGADFSVEVGDCAVLADPEALHLILRNLICNALKFTRDVAAPRVSLDAQCTGEFCRLAVSDNGIGFDMAFHDRMFQVFHRLAAARDHDGNGVGLALVKRAVERMNGRVWAVGSPGGGSTFYVDLPSGGAAPDRSPEAAPLANGGPGSWDWSGSAPSNMRRNRPGYSSPPPGGR